MSFDDRLLEILSELQADTAMRSGWDDPNEVTDLQEGDRRRAIPQIKQAFTEEGYHIGKQVNVTTPNYMTGQTIQTSPPNTVKALMKQLTK